MMINNSFNLLNNSNNKAKKLAFYTLVNALIFSAICNVAVAAENADGTELKLHKAENARAIGAVSTLTEKNGVPVLSFAPTNGGVVHETWDAFSVGKEGMIIENGLGGVGANTIVNEVVGTTYTTIAGNVSVVGTKANLYLINPNGILVQNGSFSGNVGKVVLSTGGLVDTATLNLRPAESLVVFKGNVTGVSDVYAKNILIADASVVNMQNKATLNAMLEVENNGKLAGTNLTFNAARVYNNGALNATNVNLQLKGSKLANGMVNNGTFTANNLIVNTAGFVQNNGVLNANTFIAIAKQDITNAGLLNATNVNFTATDYISNEGVMTVENATFKAPVLDNTGILETQNETLDVVAVTDNGIKNNRLTLTDVNEEEVVTPLK